MPEHAITYEQYLSNLPPERRGEVDQVWRAVRASMPTGYTEEVGPKYLIFKADDQQYVALANQKNYISLHLIPLYIFPELQTKLDASGRNLKCGKGCINFKRAEDLPLEVIAEIISANDAKAYVEHMRQMRNERRSGK
jgi:uncharacterized protein YdhG (YjbR/CyaY superfamily)